MPRVSPELQTLAGEAGVDPSVVPDLQARGILSMGILGALAKSFDEIDAAVVKPFIAGHERAGATHQAAPDTEPVVTALIRYLWKKSWTQLKTVQLVKTTPMIVSHAPSAAQRAQHPWKSQLKNFKNSFSFMRTRSLTERNVTSP